MSKKSDSNNMDETALHAQYLKGMHYLQNGRPKKAAICLYPLARAYPQNRMVREALGRALYGAGYYDIAAKYFLKIIEACPVEDYAHYCLGLAYEKIGWDHLATGHLRLARAMSPLNPHYSLSLDLHLWNQNAGLV